MPNRLRNLLIRHEDPYLGADMALSRRMGALLWSFGLILSVALWPLSPPTREIGGAGWALSGALLALGILYILALRMDRVRWSYELLLASGYAGVVMIAVAQWLAGGVGAPYERLLLLSVLYVAAVHPVRRIVPFMGFVALVLALPFIYDGWNADAVAGSFAEFVVWTAISVVAHLMMRNVRAQRISLRRGESEAREQARLDELTGIGNRRAFEEAIDDEVARVRRLDNPLSVAMLDIERFKSVNDEFGHLQGDECLRDVASAITSQLRAPDRCYRWGGDEFILLLPGTGGDGAERFAERMRNFVAVRCKRPDGESLLVRYGTGELEGGMSPADLVARADLALGPRPTRRGRSRF